MSRRDRGFLPLKEGILRAHFVVRLAGRLCLSCMNLKNIADESATRTDTAARSGCEFAATPLRELLELVDVEVERRLRL